MLGIEDHAFHFLGYNIIIESGIFVEHFDGSFVPAVEQDGAFALIPVAGVEEVLLFEGFAG